MVIYGDNEIKDSIKRVNEFIKKNKKKPNTVRISKDTLKINDYLKIAEIKDGLNRINKFIEKNNQYPKYVDIKGIQINKQEYKLLYGTKIYKVATIKKDNDEVVTYFKKVFGNFKTFDDALRLVNNKGYAYYYDDVYSNKACIDRIKARKGINCTDSCQLFWHIGKSLNFKVDVLHVQCQSGGHVRLKLTKNGKTYYRDPASVLSDNGKPINNNWCANAPLIAVNPKWFMDTVNK